MLQRSLAIGVAVAALMAPASAGATDDGFVLGSGEARATVVRAGPRVGQLPVAMEFGQALAGYQGTVGRAQARTVDLGLVGFVMTDTLGTSCQAEPFFPPETLPPTSRADADEPGATSEQATVPSEDAPLAHQRATASQDPASEASVELAPFGLPGVVEISGARADSTTRVTDGSRLAEAITTIGSLRLGGSIELRGVTWQARQRTDSDAEVAEATGTFGIDSIAFGGSEVASPSTELVTDVLTALRVTGLTVVPPTLLRTDDGSVVVTPLTVRVEAPESSRSVVGPLLGLAGETRQPLVDVLGQLDCRLNLFVLLADVLLAIPGGTGAVELSIGGASAVTEGRSFDSPFGALESIAPLAVAAGRVSAEPPSGGAVSAADAVPDEVRAAATGTRQVEISETVLTTESAPGRWGTVIAACALALAWFASQRLHRVRQQRLARRYAR